MAVPDAVLDLPDGPAWEAWLEEHHANAPGAWLRIPKLGSGLASLSTGEALDGEVLRLDRQAAPVVQLRPVTQWGRG